MTLAAIATYAPHRGRAQQVLIVGETLLLTSILVLAVALWRDGLETFDEPRRLLLEIPPAAMTLQLMLYFVELYGDRPILSRVEFLVRLLVAWLGALLALSLLYYVAPPFRIERTALTTTLVMMLPALTAWRSLHAWLLANDVVCERVLVVGTGMTAHELTAATLDRSTRAYRIAGFLGEHPAELGHDRAPWPPVIGVIDDLAQRVLADRITTLAVALEDRRGRMPVDALLACRMRGVNVVEASTLYERITGKLLLSGLRPSWFVFADGFQRSRLVPGLKRNVEVVLAAALLVATGPVLLGAMLLTKLLSPGPALYLQERVGENGRTFELLKIRTMRPDAEKGGPVMTAAGRDPRITPLGRLLRKCRLDELPQLINILRGDMSFVGPRPERPVFVDMFRDILPFYDARHSVKPGLTGWAQVKFRYGATIEDAEEKLQYDLYYVKRMSLLFDLIILAHTVKVMLFARGAR